ncbi:hypothetical protein J437_LFUL005676, partial [Ladona fulva]
LTVNASQEERSSSPSDKKPASIGKKSDNQYSKEQIMELRKNSTSKQGSGDGSAEDDAGGSRETENSVQVEEENTEKPTLPGKKPKYQYTREQLMELRNHPLSRQKPSIPNNSSIFSSDAPPFHRTRAWDQEQWHHGSRHENAVEEDRGGRGDGPHETHKRRPGDPRERIRKEQDGIVLSPQRRNFNCGCFVVLSPQQQQNQQTAQHQQASSNRRPDSPLGKGEREGHREIAPNRRIGSGRIINRERDREYWVDYRVDREKDADGDFGGFRGIRDRDREERAIRSERRPFGRDFDRDRDTGFGGGSNGGVNERGNVGSKGSSERNSGRSGRYGNDRDRRRSFSDARNEEEPEWFSGGPTSQHEVIELRGFEDIPEDSVAPNSGGHTSHRAKKQSQSSKSGQKSGGSKNVAAAKKSPHGSGKTSPSLSQTEIINAVVSGQSSDKDQSDKISQPSPKISKPPSPTQAASNKTADNMDQRHPNASGGGDFNLDDILKMDSFPGLLTNGSATEGPVGGSSRFCQWFRPETPPATAMMIMSSQQNQENNIASDISNKAPGAAVNQGPDSRRSSLHDELLNNMINEITEPNIVIPSLGGPDSYFAPISPAASTNLGGGATIQDQESASKSSLLLEMLHRGSHQRPQRQQQPDNMTPGLIKPPTIKDLEITGKLHSVEELEARLRQNSAVGGSVQGSGGSRNFAPGVGRGRVKPDGADSDITASGQSDEDMAAFKKLLAQVSGGQAIPAANGVGQHIDLLQSLQMLSKKDAGSTHQPSNLNPQPGVATSGVPNLNDPGILGGILSGNAGLAPSPAQLGSGPSLSRPSPMQHVIPADVVMRLLQVQQQQSQQLQRHQQEWFSKLNAAQQQQQQQTAQQTMLMQPPPHSHIPHLHHGGQTQGISQRVQGQLGPLSGIPNLPASPTPSTSLSPLPPELQMVINQAQPGRDLLQRPEAPNMMRGMAPHRVPSPGEIRAHTQQILHAALIKRKLEEQKENYRRRQEGQQMSHSPNPNTGKVEPSTPPAKHSPTPLAFTPTSVLRKMTAEKDPLASSENSGSASSSIGKADMKNQGRAIVKGSGGNSMSNHYGSSVMDYQTQKMSHMMENPSQASSNLLQNAGHGLPGNQYPLGSRPIKNIQRTGMMNSGAGGGMSANTVHPQFMKPPVMLLRPSGANAAATAARG